MIEIGIIKKLDEEVVNRIAAGEIVQRPANALKELIENSLDAHSTNIIITVKAGGLKYLQIQDNGTGIRSNNLDIVCERFTTSKLSQYEDLQAITTYGFRGEALASISHIAHLTILTKTANDKCAYKASYENGKLKGPVKPCAGNNGTQITVEDLFYNVIARKRALRSPNEEYTHIMDVVGGYAIHNCHVGFTLKKFGEKTDIKTPIKSSVIENVRIIHGNSIARELLEIELKDSTLKLSMHGFITNVNYSHKKGTMLLFINHRLVDSSSIRKAVDTVYATYLPKNAHSYVYLSLELDPKNVDVNVHPTKHEVQFLYEEQIIDRIKSAIENKLLSCNSSRVMYTQARLPGATMVEEIVKKTTDGAKMYPKDLVRVDSDVQKIDKFFRVTNKPTEQIDNRDSRVKDKVSLSTTEMANIDDIEMATVNLATQKDKEDNIPIEIDMDDVVNDTDKLVAENVSVEAQKNDKEPSIPIEVDEDSNVIESSQRTPRFIFEDTESLNDLENCLISEPNDKNTDENLNELEMSLISEPNDKVKKNENWKSAAVDNNISYIDPKESFKTRTFKQVRLETKLTSVKQLRLDVENKCNMNLREILANLIFIACIDCHKSLIQHSTKLYLCDTTLLTEELFYETMLYDFQNLGLIKLSNPLPLEELIMLGLKSQEAEWNPELGKSLMPARYLNPPAARRAAPLKESHVSPLGYDSFHDNEILLYLENYRSVEVSGLELFSLKAEWRSLHRLGDMREMAQQMSKLLMCKRAMLLEYFSFEISSQGELLALPLLLDGHTPFMGALPTYLVRLVTEVDWESEKECFNTFSRQTAIFYSQPNPDSSEDVLKSEMWKQEHVVFPAIRRNFLPPTSFVSNGAILQIASLHDLYKVFERC